MLVKYAEKYGLAIWAYCLMTNHVHFVVVPNGDEAMGQTFRDTHQAYASWLNRRIGQRGHLWQGRFFSCVLDEPHLWAAVRYVERNPVRAGIVTRAEEYPWSSAAGHCGLRTDTLLSDVEMPWPVEDWSAFLRDEDEESVATTIRRNTTTGRPCGSTGFVKHLESLLARILHLRKRGPKPKPKTKKAMTAKKSPKKRKGE